MKAIKLFLMLIGISMVLSTWAAPVVTVLQNGLDSYQGCDDALVFYKETEPGMTAACYGAHDSLKIYWANA